MAGTALTKTHLSKTMYQEMKACRKPENENAKIWRYMDFTKFVSLLKRQSLFFTSVDALRETDPYEGAIPRATRMNGIFETVFGSVLKNIENADEKLLVQKLREMDSIKQSQLDMRAIFDRFTLVNCWHTNDFESAAMWKLYCSSHEGIAIQSTFRRLADSFVEADTSPCYGGGGQIPVNIGMIDYYDESGSDLLPPFFSLYPSIYLIKRSSFEHEKELRAITFLGGVQGDKEITLGNIVAKSVRDEFEQYKGVYFPVKLETLIEQVYISPTSLHWFSEIVKDVLNKYDINVPVISSNLLQKPPY